MKEGEPVEWTKMMRIVSERAGERERQRLTGRPFL